MDVEMVKGGGVIKRFCSVFDVLRSMFYIVFMMVPAPWSPIHCQEPRDTYYISFIEDRGDSFRKLLATMEGDRISVERLRGTFPKDLKTKPPWYLKGLKPFEEEISMEFENLAPFILKRNFKKGGEVPLSEETLQDYQITYLLEAREEAIPLSEEERKLNELLKPLNIQEIRLEGKGRLLFHQGRQIVFAEEFSLKGMLIQNHIKKDWQIFYARGLSPFP